jgi:hypothetical protein
MGISLGAPRLIGKTIIGVVKKENIRGSNPASQVFLIFSDNTYYEFYSFSSIMGTSDACKGGTDEVRRNGEGTMQIVLESYLPE